MSDVIYLPILRIHTLHIGCVMSFYVLVIIAWRDSVKLIRGLKKHKYWMSCYYKIIELLVSLLDYVNIELLFSKSNSIHAL